MIAGFSYAEARRMMPGFIRDMYMIRYKYDQALMVGKIGKALGL